MKYKKSGNGTKAVRIRMKTVSKYANSNTFAGIVYDLRQLISKRIITSLKCHNNTYHTKVYYIY